MTTLRFMLYQLLGGPTDMETPVPWPAGVDPPPFMCSGSNEPFQHYILLDTELPLFVHIGPCSSIDHQGSYPHSPFDSTENPRPSRGALRAGSGG